MHFGPWRCPSEWRRVAFFCCCWSIWLTGLLYCYTNEDRVQSSKYADVDAYALIKLIAYYYIYLYHQGVYYREKTGQGHQYRRTIKSRTDDGRKRMDVPSDHQPPFRQERESVSTLYRQCAFIERRLGETPKTRKKKRKKRGGCIAPHYKRRAPFFPLRPPPPSSFFPHTSMGFSLVPITTTSADTQEEEEGKKKVTRGARRLGASTWAARPLQQKTGIVIYLYIYIYISAWCVCDAASRNNLCSYWPASAWAKRGSRKSPTEKTCCNQSCCGGLALPISCGGDY